MPIYLWTEGNLAPMSDVYVEVKLGSRGGTQVSSPILGTETIVFPLSAPGYFDAGLGSLGLSQPGTDLGFQIRAWRGFEGRQLVYDGAFIRGTSESWIQKAGDPILHIPSPILLDYAPTIPEHSTLTYGVIGAATLLTNGLMKTLKQKAPTSTNTAPTKVTLVSTNAPASAKTK